MKWNVNDIEMYMQSKEYVDTVIIPLIPVSWSKELKSSVAMGEFIFLISSELERQFKGRLVLTPSFTYLKQEDLTEKANRLVSWRDEIKEENIQNVFYLTSDSQWKEVEKDIGETLIWLPTLPLENMDEQYKSDMLSEQVKQLMPIFINKWKS